MKCCEFDTSGLYYKHSTIVNDDSSFVNKWRVSLNADTRVVIYDCNMFIIQSTGSYSRGAIWGATRYARPYPQLLWYCMEVTNALAYFSNVYKT